MSTDPAPQFVPISTVKDALAYATSELQQVTSVPSAEMGHLLNAVIGLKSAVEMLAQSETTRSTFTLDNI